MRVVKNKFLVKIWIKLRCTWWEQRTWLQGTSLGTFELFPNKNKNNNNNNNNNNSQETLTCAAGKNAFLKTEFWKYRFSAALCRVTFSFMIYLRIWTCQRRSSWRRRRPSQNSTSTHHHNRRRFHCRRFGFWRTSSLVPLAKMGGLGFLFSFLWFAFRFAMSGVIECKQQSAKKSLRGFFALLLSVADSLQPGREAPTAVGWIEGWREREGDERKSSLACFIERNK